MKHVRILLLALCVLLAASWLNPTNAYATEVDGLVVSITSDAPEYRAHDTAVFTIEMTNESPTPATDVEYSVTLPTGMEVQGEASLTAEVSKIGPGETVVRTVEAYVYEDTTVEGSHITGGDDATEDDDNVGDAASDSNTENGNAASQVADTADSASGSTAIPQTGDWSMAAVVACAVAGLVAIAAGFIAKRKKGGTGVLSIALCLLAAGVVFSGVNSAYADEYVSRQTDASCRVSVNGSQDDATVSVSYTALEQTPNPGVGGEAGGSVLYEFSDDVLVVDDYQYIEGAYLFESDQHIAVGDKIAFDDFADEETLAVGFVTQASEIGDDTLVQIDQATNPEDVFEYIAIDYGTPIDWSEVELIDGVTIEDTPSTLASHSGVQLPKITFKMNQKLSAGGKITGKFSMSNWIDVKFDWSLWNGLKEAKLGFDSSTELSVDGVGSISDGEAITLNKKPIMVSLGNGACVFVNFNLRYTLEGKIGVTISLDTSAGVQYRNGRLATYNNSDADVEFGAEANAKFGVAPAATLTLMSVELIDVQLEGGAAGTADETLRNTGLVCLDIDAYAYLELSSGHNTVWMEAIGLTLSYDIWNKETSPLSWHFHMENGSFVKECSYNASGNPSKPVDPDDDSADEPVSADGFEYMDWQDGIMITAYNGNETSIVFPVQIDGKDVVAVSCTPASAKRMSFEEGSKVEIFGFGFADITSDEAVLATVDFSNATKMRTISIVDYGTLTSLDLSGLSLLEFAEYHSYNAQSSTAFTGVVLKGNDALTELYVDAYTANTTASPDLSEAPHLESLRLNWCGITSLDVARNSELIYLSCTNNNITYLDASVLRNLARRNDGFVLECDGNRIGNINELEVLAEELGYSSEWVLTPQK